MKREVLSPRAEPLASEYQSYLEQKVQGRNRRVHWEEWRPCQKKESGTSPSPGINSHSKW